jgi:two-component system sensor histidine kinase VicK
MPHNSSSNLFKYFKELSEHTDNIIFAYQVERTKFSFLNPAFEKVWNISIDKAISNPALLIEAVHPDDKGFIINSYKELLQGKKKEKIEFRLLLDNGNIRWLCLKTPLLIKEENNQNVIIGVLEELTEIKERYDTLEKFAAKKNSILEILSHDLAGPLKNIKGLSSHLAEEIKEYNNKELEEVIAMLINTSERSIQLIRDFVQQEFLESANSTFTKNRVNIVKKIKESIEQYSNSEKNIGKIFNFAVSHEEIFIEVDVFKFIQVIINLISNSIKFTPDGGIITVNVEDKQDSVLFTLADNGIDIPEKHHDELFEKFTHARRPGLKGEPSTGLGMSIIKTIVEWHNGRIWFDSKENQGTTFFIDLPKE